MHIVKISTIAFRNITDHNHEITDRVWQASFKCVCALSQNRSSKIYLFSFENNQNMEIHVRRGLTLPKKIYNLQWLPSSVFYF